MSTTEISVIGIDLAKTVFHVHGVDKGGEVVMSRELRRSELIRFVARLTPCLIGMEASGGAHYWSRVFSSQGHTVRLMAPSFVKPYVKSNKNDARDAEAICEAVQRPSMRFVTPKSVEQQSVLHAHRSRTLLVRQRVALGNHIRGLLHEFGIVFPLGLNALSSGLIDTLEDADVGNAGSFRNGRQLAAYLGLVPRQASSGGKQRLLGISKRGDGYVRRLLVQGAKSVTRYESGRLKAGQPVKNEWLGQLLRRGHSNKVAVALANKMARVAWVLLSRDERYVARATA